MQETLATMTTSRRLTSLALVSLAALAGLLAAGELAPEAWRATLRWSFAATSFAAIGGLWLWLRGEVFGPLHALGAALAKSDESALRHVIETLPAGEIASVMQSAEQRLTELRTDVGHIRNAADALSIRGGQPRASRLASFGDHRLAMAAAIAANAVEGESVVEGWQAIAVSYPEFTDDLMTVTGRA